MIVFGATPKPLSIYAGTPKHFNLMAELLHTQTRTIANLGKIMASADYGFCHSLELDKSNFTLIG
jgi:hypothetical protein